MVIHRVSQFQSYFIAPNIMTEQKGKGYHFCTLYLTLYYLPLYPKELPFYKCYFAKQSV